MNRKTLSTPRMDYLKEMHLYTNGVKFIKNPPGRNWLWRGLMVVALSVATGTNNAFADASSCANPFELNLEGPVRMKFCEIPAAQGVSLRDLNDTDGKSTNSHNFEKFQMSQFEVTQLQYKTIMGTEPWKRRGADEPIGLEGDDNPAVYVNFEEATLFARILGLLDRKAIYRVHGSPESRSPDVGFRLVRTLRKRAKTYYPRPTETPCAKGWVAPGQAQDPYNFAYSFGVVCNKKHQDYHVFSISNGGLTAKVDAGEADPELGTPETFAKFNSKLQKMEDGWTIDNLQSIVPVSRCLEQAKLKHGQDQESLVRAAAKMLLTRIAGERPSRCE